VPSLASQGSKPSTNRCGLHVACNFLAWRIGATAVHGQHLCPTADAAHAEAEKYCASLAPCPMTSTGGKLASVCHEAGMCDQVPDVGCC
jgi:hypothetical protein